VLPFVLRLHLWYRHRCVCRLSASNYLAVIRFWGTDPARPVA
jgi:hypothetical protein